MMESNLIKFLALLGIKETRRYGEWLQFACPLASITHGKRTDRNPSGGALISDDGPSLFRCFSCTPKAQPLDTLLARLWRYNKGAKEAIYFWASYELSEDVSVDGIAADRWETEVESPQVLDSAIVERFPLIGTVNGDFSKDALKYLNCRGVSQKTAQKRGVRLWSEKDALVFPYHDNKGRIVTLRCRRLFSKTLFFVSSENTGLPRDAFPLLSRTGAWFGLAAVNWQKPVVLVEGEFDALRLVELGQSNVVASGGTSITNAQLKALLGRSLWLGLDADKSGREAETSLVRRLATRGYDLHFLDWSVAKHKDAGDLENVQELNRVLQRLK
jgi:DNA primase